jgi:aconitase A
LKSVAPKDLAVARSKIDTPEGKAWSYNPMALKDFGYDITALPYSVRVLLENALRHAGRVAGADEAANALA